MGCFEIGSISLNDNSCDDLLSINFRKSKKIVKLAKTNPKKETLD